MSSCCYAGNTGGNCGRRGGKRNVRQRRKEKHLKIDAEGKIRLEIVERRKKKVKLSL
jgi:hypothetical protein